MQTSTQTKPTTIQEWKDRALATEQANEAAMQAAMEKQAAYETLLLNFIRADLPLGEFFYELRPRDNYDSMAIFRVPGHAEIIAAYHQDYDGECHQTSLDRNGYSHDKYRVRVYGGVSRERNEDGDGEYYPIYDLRNGFIELGDALLFAERNYTDPAVIASQVAETNAAPRVTQETVSTETPPVTPPTLAENLVTVLKELIDERVDNKLGRHEYEYHQQ